MFESASAEESSSFNMGPVQPSGWFIQSKMFGSIRRSYKALVPLLYFGLFSGSVALRGIWVSVVYSARELGLPRAQFLTSKVRGCWEDGESCGFSFMDTLGEDMTCISLHSRPPLEH